METIEKLEKELIHDMVIVLNKYGCNLIYKHQSKKRKRDGHEFGGVEWTVDMIKWNDKRCMYESVNRACFTDVVGICEQCNAIYLSFTDRVMHLSALRIHNTILDVTNEIWYLEEVYSDMKGINISPPGKESRQTFIDLHMILTDVKATISSMNKMRDRVDTFTYRFTKGDESVSA